MSEQWRPIPGFPGYEISTLTRVRSSKPWRGEALPRLLRPWLNRPDERAYWYVTLVCPDESGRRHRPLHVLMLLAFIGARPLGCQARHLNGNRRDNSLSNLAWGTPSENRRDKLRHGTDHNATRTHCKNGHEFTPENTRRRGHGRVCVTCRRRRDAAAKRLLRSGSS